MLFDLEVVHCTGKFVEKGETRVVQIAKCAIDDLMSERSVDVDV